VEAFSHIADLKLHHLPMVCVNLYQNPKPLMSLSCV
jgi:hypothetical protein